MVQVIAKEIWLPSRLVFISKGNLDTKKPGLVRLFYVGIQG